MSHWFYARAVIVCAGGFPARSGLIPIRRSVKKNSFVPTNVSEFVIVASVER